MSQEVLLAQFQKYLLVRWTEYIDGINRQYAGEKDPSILSAVRQRVQEESDYLSSLNQILDRGRCFGLSVCHAAMTLIGKKVWWEDALVTLYQWDGSKEALKKEIMLRDGTRFITMQELFELALNYIEHSHGVVNAVQGEFFPLEVTQQTALLPSTKVESDGGGVVHHLEIVDAQGKVLTVQKNQRVAGNFSKDQLRALLDEATFRDNMGLIHSKEHTIHIRCRQDGKWELYDPNFEHADAATMCVIGTKDEVIDAVFKSMGTHGLAIEVASLDPAAKINLSAFEDFVRRDPAALLTPESLQVMAMEAPEQLREIFRTGGRMPEGQAVKAAVRHALQTGRYDKQRHALHIIARYAPDTLADLFALADPSKEGEGIVDELVNAMGVKSDAGIIPLQIIAGKSEDGMLKLLDIAASPAGGSFFINRLSGALAEKMPESQVTALDLMAQSSSKALPALFDLAYHNPDSRPLRVELTRLLQEKDALGVMRLLPILEKSPDILPGLLRLMPSADCKALHQLMSSKSDDGKSLRYVLAQTLTRQAVFHKMMHEMPGEMYPFINLVLMDNDQPRNLDAVLRALASTEGDKTGWQLISEKLGAKEKLQFLHMLSNHLDDFSTKNLVDFCGELNRALTDDRSRYRGLCNERHKMFRSNHYGKTSIWQELITKSQAILRQRKDAATVQGVQEILKIKSGR